MLRIPKVGCPFKGHFTFMLTSLNWDAAVTVTWDLVAVPAVNVPNAESAVMEEVDFPITIETKSTSDSDEKDKNVVLVKYYTYLSIHISIVFHKPPHLRAICIIQGVSSLRSLTPLSLCCILLCMCGRQLYLHTCVHEQASTRVYSAWSCDFVNHLAQEIC